MLSLGLALELESQIRDRIASHDPKMLSNDTNNQYQPLTPLESHQLSPCHSVSDLFTPGTPSPHNTGPDRSPRYCSSVIGVLIDLTY